MSSQCYLCGVAEDSLDHCFVACPFVRPVWESFCISLSLPLNLSLGVFDFFSHCWGLDSPCSSLLYLLPQVICWEVWKARMHCYFNGSQQVSSSQLMSNVSFLLRVITTCKPLRIREPRYPSMPCLIFRPVHRRTQLVFWNPPPPNCWKLNTDGSSLGNPGFSGGGFVLRDSFGHVHHAQAIFLGVTTSFHAELQALLHGLSYCMSVGCHPVYVECDSQAIITLLHSRGPFPWRYLTPFHEIVAITTSLRCHLTHIFREGNSLADFLARHASSMQNSFTFSNSSLPPLARGIVRLDQASVPNLRTRFV